jgi:hypothetical protein
MVLAEAVSRSPAAEWAAREHLALPFGRPGKPRLQICAKVAADDLRQLIFARGRFFAGAECRFAAAFPTLAIGVGAEECGDYRANDQHGDESQIALAASEGDRQQRP